MKLKSGFIKTRILDDWVVVPADDSEAGKNFVIQINETGAAIWDGIEAGKTPEQIAEDLVAEYDVDLEKAKCDTEAFLANLKEIHLLEE